MARDITQESKTIRNGNRYVTELSGTGVFPRDSDRLFVQYENLRLAIYNRYAPGLGSEASKDELRSYIDEQFIRLVKEYEVNSAVDFPGYVKTKLNMRVKHVFMHNYFRDRNREPLVVAEGDYNKETGVEDTTDDYVRHEMTMLIDAIVSPVNPTEIERDILDLMLREKGYTDIQVMEALSKKHEVTQGEIRDTIRQLREFIRHRLQEIESAE